MTDKEPSFRNKIIGYLENMPTSIDLLVSTQILDDYNRAIERFIEVTNLDHEDQRALKEIMGVPE